MLIDIIGLRKESYKVMAKYIEVKGEKLDDILGTSVDYILREDGAMIPIYEDNRDYQAYLRWKATGSDNEVAI